MQHRIKHINVDLQVKDQKQAADWSERMQKALAHLSSPAMSKWFDQQAPPGTYVHINRLEIQLGELDMDLSSDRLAEKFMNALQAQLKPLIKGQPTEHSSTEVVLGQANWQAHWLEQYLINSTWSREVLDESPIQSWQHLLQEDKAKLKAIAQKAIQIGGQYAAERLVLQWPVEDFIWLLHDEWVKSLQLSKALVWQKRYGEVAYRKLLVELLLAQFQQNQLAQASLLPILQKWWQSIQQAMTTDEPAIIWKMRQQLQKWLPHLLKEAELDELLPIGTSIHHNEHSAEAKESKKPVETTPTSWSIAHAGLVLVHPFLSACFADLGYLNTDKKAFRSETDRHRAITLLHYMAVGEKELTEEEAGMYKLLCEIDQAAPIPLDIRLNDREKQEAEQMLESLIQHWSALGKSSTDGLREAFLQRPGSLLRDELSPVLYVEHKAMDILLKKLPWGLSIIRLPWLSEFIRVEWPN